jgi:4-amino-4-deoxy-L-arabinose transferase-like glycosyltransferase
MTLSAARPDDGYGPPSTGASQNPASRLRVVSVLLILLLWAAVYFAGIFSPALLDDADSVHAEAAREMLTRHDWSTLYTNGVRYLEKAPLLYWGIAVSYEVFGVTDWSSRLPLMLGVLALLLATYALGTFAFEERAGLYSALVLGTSIGPYIFTRFLIPDILIGLWLTLSAYCFLLSLREEKPSRLACWGFAASCALNVLTKGLIGLVFPFAMVGGYLLLTGNLRHLLKLRLVSSTLVFLALAAPWHVVAAMRNPSQGDVRGFLWFYFVNEHFRRFIGTRVPPGYDTVPLGIFWALLIAWVLPWSAFLPQALRDVPWRVRAWRSGLDQQRQAQLVCVLWVLVIVGFFSFSTRQEYYTIPAVPGLALLVGAWLAREDSSESSSAERRAGRISSVVLLVFGVVACAVGLYLFSVSTPPSAGADLADLLKKNPQDYDFSLGHVLDLTPRALGAFRAPLLGTSLALLLGGLLNWMFRRKGQAESGNVALVGMMVVVLTCVHFAFVTFSPILSSQTLAAAIQPYYRPGDIVAIDGEYHRASTLNFYLGVPVRVVHEPSGNLWYGVKFPDAPRVFETPESLRAMWTAPGRVFLWTESDAPKLVEGLASYPVAHSGGKYIFSNQPLSR